MDKNDFVAKIPVFLGTCVGGLTLILIIFSFSSGLLGSFGKPAEFYLSQPAGSGCTTGINYFHPHYKCGADCYYEIEYRCLDGFSGKVANEPSCRSSSAWRNYIQTNICSQHPFCRSPLPSPLVWRPSSTPLRSVSLSPMPVSYRLELQPSATIVTPVHKPNEGYGIQALLQDSSGQVVVNQADFNYTWSIDDSTAATISPFTSCTQGIQPPCPYDHVEIHALKQTSLTYIRVNVKKISLNQTVAQGVFKLTVLPASPSPSPAY